VGVAANQANSQGQVLIAALAALFAGALSMAVGEYVSVASQKDMEDADLEKYAPALARSQARLLCAARVR
jgi:VIT1/CCC1 family predicted Fe2+/Mn2+ transporter